VQLAAEKFHVEVKVQPEACSIPLRLLNPRDEVTIPRGTAVAELENVVAEVGGESAVPPGSMGVVVVSDDKEAGELTALH